MKIYYSLLFAILALVACTDGAGIEEPSEITLETPVATIKPTENSTVIKFFAPEAWTAEVITTRADDWCTISPTSGDAGEATITVTTTANNTSEDRFAQIVIKSGETEKTVEVKQDQKYEIIYTSIDGEIVEPENVHAFDANIVSNVYKDGKGIITFERAISQIGNYAFMCCDNLTSITIPNSVTSIGIAAFSACNNMTSVTIGNRVASIGDTAFLNCSGLTSVTIPDSVTEIGDNAFISCHGLTSVTIPDSVTTIGDGAFDNCTGLTNVTIGNGVTSIGIGAFNCRSLTSFDGKFASADNRCLIIDGVLNSFAPAGLTEYTIPNGITSIEACAFSACSQLTSVTIPNGVISIGDSAFDGCRSLESITIPDSVTSIGSSAFAACYNLTSFNSKFASADNRCLIIDGVLKCFAPAELTEYTIPDNITSIGSGAFQECSKLTTITIPDSVTSIGRVAFWGCRSLTSITIPDSVTTIGDGLFWDCECLKSINIPDSVTSIGAAAFSYCTSLTSVTIPVNVTSIGQRAFDGCSRLISVYCKPTTPPALESGAFQENPSNRKIYVPWASYDAYKAAYGWKDYEYAILGYNF